jgi:hypothetical protein
MHVHLPKAFHGWRELAKEVGIIVLGVLIALGFEQLAQEWRWHEQARETRQALTNEISYDALFASERVAVQQCLRDRIKDLVSKLNNSGVHWAADPMVFGRPRKPIAASMLVTGIPSAYRAPGRPWLGDEWETAKSSGIVDHMSRDDAHDFEFIYKGIDRLRALEEEETSLEPEVSILSFDQTLEPQSRVQAMVALARLDSVNSWSALTARQMLGTVRTMHLQLTSMTRRKRQKTFDASRRQLMDEDRDRFGPCVDPRPLL